MFEGSAHPVSGGGLITLTDAHGGATGETWGRLRNSFPVRLPDEEVATSTQVVIYFAWSRPGRYEGGVDATPGDLVQFQFRHRYGPSQPSLLLIYPYVRIVHFATADVPWASRSAVDSSDLSAIAAYLGYPACYGLSSEDPGCPVLSWGSDTNADEVVDMSDVSVWAWQYEYASNCKLGKAVPEEERAATVLAWFGMVYSGDTENFHGREIPRTVLVNEAQMRRAILDPYGYRNRTAASVRQESWSRVKSVYR